MTKIASLFKKEISYYFNTPVGYVAFGLFAVFANFLFMKELFLRGTSSIRPFFDAAVWILLFFIPAISMRMFAEENRSHTIEVLLSLPIKESSIVLGKFFAVIAGFIVALMLTLSVPAALFVVGIPSVSEIIVSYVGLILLGSFYSAVSLFFSSLTKNQLIAYLSAVVVLFIMIVSGGDFFTSVIPGAIKDSVSLLAPLNHYYMFLKGVIDVRAIFYFMSNISFFIFLTIINLEKRT